MVCREGRRKREREREGAGIEMSFNLGRAKVRKVEISSSSFGLLVRGKKDQRGGSNSERPENFNKSSFLAC